MFRNPRETKSSTTRRPIKPGSPGNQNAIVQTDNDNDRDDAECFARVHCRPFVKYLCPLIHCVFGWIKRRGASRLAVYFRGGGRQINSNLKTWKTAFFVACGVRYPDTTRFTGCPLEGRLTAFRKPLCSIAGGGKPRSSLAEFRTRYR